MSHKKRKSILDKGLRACHLSGNQVLEAAPGAVGEPHGQDRCWPDPSRGKARPPRGDPSWDSYP